MQPEPRKIRPSAIRQTGSGLKAMSGGSIDVPPIQRRSTMAAGRTTASNIHARSDAGMIWAIACLLNRGGGQHLQLRRYRDLR